MNGFKIIRKIDSKGRAVWSLFAVLALFFLLYIVPLAAQPASDETWYQYDAQGGLSLRLTFF